MAVWQLDDVGSDAGTFQPQRQLMGSLLPRLVFVLVEDDIRGTARLISKLRQLGRR